MSLSCSPLRALLPALGSALLSALLPALPLLAAPADAAAQQARVIVKLRAHSDLLNGRAAALGTVPATGEPARMRRLGERIGVVMQDGRRISERMQVAQASGITSEALARKLSAQADVEWAAVDRRVKAADLPPNDNMFSSPPSAPNGQWYLRAPDSTLASATNALNAWALTRGAPNVVVAIIDTGVRFDHPDLKYKLLPGYDVITNPWIANDDSGRDADATDVGDRLTSADKAAHPNLFAECEVNESSSWHGTKVAGIIGAHTNNSRGVAGIGWNVRILPVRALGRCGGYVSDVAAGIRWAAGLRVDDLPINPNPARVVNLSLGSDDAANCNTNDDFAAYREAINEVTALGVVVVAAAGNSEGAVSPPGNCANTITVAGLRHNGAKAGYSAYGSDVTISAPAGNCVNSWPYPCDYSFVTTTNADSIVPVIGTDAYTSSSAPAYGTSFSAPLVSGTVALMLSVNPNLTSAQVKDRLTQSARPFPSPLSPIYNCRPAKDVDHSCNCDTSICGAGMLDTQAAVTAAMGLDFVGEADPGAPAPNEILTFTVAATALDAGETLPGVVHWSIQDTTVAIDNSASQTATNYVIKPLGNGQFTVRAAFTTNLGTRVLTRTVVVGDDPGVSPQPITSESPTVSRSSGGGGALDAGWLLGLVGVLAVAQRGLRRRGS